MNKEIEHIDVSQEAKLIMDRIDRYEKQKRSTVHMIKPLTAIAAVAVLFLLPFFLNDDGSYGVTRISANEYRLNVFGEEIYFNIHGYVENPNLIQLTDEFSIAFAYGICEKNPYVRILYVTFAILSLLTMIYLYTKYIIRIQMQDLFLGMPLPKKKWCITAVLMPVLICLFYIYFTKGTFEKGNLTYKEIIDVVTISILSSGIKAAVTEEIVFRGMILRLLQNTFGKKCAVFVSSFLFAVYHFDGIDTSDIKKVIMMIISVEIAGIALALVTEQTGSIWSSVMIHCLYNILSGESQIFHIDVAQNFPAIWMYTVNSKNMLLTGINGSVGFTASIPTMAGFTGIILMVIYDEKKKKTYGNKL